MRILRPALSVGVFIVLGLFSNSSICAHRGSDSLESRTPQDPQHNPIRPDRNPYEVGTTVNGDLSSVETAIARGRQACEGKPPRYEEAEKYFVTAAHLDPKEARAFIGLGIVYAGENRAEDAIAAFQKAIELNPKLPDSHFNLGLIFAAIGEKDKAMDQFTVLKKLDKKLAKKLKEAIEKSS